ncbi:CapA family protein [Salarchaeum sp. JOR-1]|uniref:CapA family protein n=1 Tax=Salarchaeum sp. JOR-1 TaxID=2599399 RepID=UPI001198AD99|nr:CapA family protein [Salarchaeum sp. JOR-1]QDX41726.1 CapA family protein [Salarchaeum sp. JOR-1]
MPLGEFILAATGDAILTPQGVEFEDQPESFNALLNVLRRADASIAQVEPVLVDEGTHHASLRQVTDQYQYLGPFPGAIMGAPPAVLDELTKMGLNLFTVASNHALDFGQDGLRTTLAAMRERELPFAGIGEDLADAREPTYLETEAGRVGVIDASTSVPPGGEAGVSTSTFSAECGINPLHVEWTYRIPPEQLDQLRAIAETVGIEDVKNEWLRRENPDWHTDDAYYFMQMRFAPATAERPSGIYQSLHRRDSQAILSQVETANANADWVVMALHSHQARDGNRNTNEIPVFLQQYAHTCVDAGADAVVVTGPHTTRGIEIYQQRPICYSLGNFFFQEEAIFRIPKTADADLDSTVPDVRGDDASTEVDSDGDHDADNWQSIIPEIVFDDRGHLDQVTLYPCTLQPDAEPPQRGTPVLATGEQARTILQKIATRSKRFGTTIHTEDGVGVIDSA